jgi:hypothetical protein
MLSHDMTESTSNRVVINDFDFQTMQELLRYMYCKNVLNLKEVALDLLQAADKVSYNFFTILLFLIFNKIFSTICWN